MGEEKAIENKTEGYVQKGHNKFWVEWHGYTDNENQEPLPGTTYDRINQTGRG